MKFKDYYRILGIGADAGADDIKSAYRKLARKFHPDVNKEADAHTRFTDVGEAYEALSDPQKRAAYDQLRQAGFKEGQDMDAPPPGAARGSSYQDHEGPRGSFRGAAGGASEVDLDQYSDFFQSLFGGMGGGGRSRRSAFPERGEDIHHAITVSLDEAYHGGERILRLQVPQLDAAGHPSRGERTLTVKIPRGVTRGTQIRLRGQGMPGSSNEHNGDLYLEVELAPHPLFRADGRDIRLELPVAPWEAVLGATIQVPTLGGGVTMTLPAGSQAGQSLRLKGRGLPGEPPGDQYVTFVIVVPPNASAKAQELHRELARESAFDPRAQLGAR